MPIRPENRDRYPNDWKLRSKLIRTVRAKNRCECDGRCGRHPDPCDAVNGDRHPVTGSRVVLTVAHLDHVPEHSHLANLMAMCQRCHLSYDRDHHAETKRARAHAGQATLDL